MSKQHIDAIEAAIEAALLADAVEPIIAIGSENDEWDVTITCPVCSWQGAVEVEYGKIAINTTEASVEADDRVVLGVQQWDRDRHTLAFACTNPECRTFFSDFNFDVAY